MRFSIYKLVDPRDDHLRYVGITNSMEARFQGHLHGESNPAKKAWLQELQEQGLKPIMLEIEQAATEEEARGRERWWIQELLSQGIALLNIVGVPTNSPELLKASYYISEEDDWKLEQIRIQRRRRGVKIDKSALIREAIGLLQE